MLPGRFPSLDSHVNTKAPTAFCVSALEIERRNQSFLAAVTQAAPHNLAVAPPVGWIESNESTEPFSCKIMHAAVLHT